MSTEAILLIFCVVFFFGLIYAGYITKKWVNDASDYILAGREVSLGLNIMGVAAIGYAGTTIALQPGYAISYGLYGSIGFAFIYAILGLVLYGLCFSNYIRRCGAQTLPEYLEVRYSGKVRNIVSIGTIIGLCGILANNIVSLAGVISGFIGWPVFATISVTFLCIIVFTYLSGLWAVTITDFVQMIIGLIAIPLLFILVLTKYGGWSFVTTAWGKFNPIMQGMTGASMPTLSIQYPSILTLALLFGAFLVWGNNYYWLRIASCRSERVARRSFVYAGLLLLIVFQIPLAIVGSYAGAANPGLFAPIGKIASTAAYGIIIKAFNPIIASFMIIGAAAASISTAATSAMGATATATRDIYDRLINTKASPKQKLKASKLIMVCIGVFTWLLCYFPGGPIYLFAFANAWLGPPAILLLLGIFWRRFNDKGALWGCIFGMISMAGLQLLDLMGIFMISKYTHIGVVGFVITIAVAVVVSIATQSKYYGAAGWTAKVSGSKREDVALNDFDLKVLDLIRYGHKYLSDLTDALKVDSRDTHASIEKLDRGGYIERAGLTRSKFFTFTITDNALKVLPKLSGQEEQLAHVGLKPLYLEILKISGESSKDIQQFMKDKNLTSLELSSIISHLVRQDYILEKGLWRRKLQVTSKGREAVQKFATIAA